MYVSFIRQLIHIFSSLMRYSRLQLSTLLGVVLFFLALTLNFALQFKAAKIKESWLGPRDAHDIQWEAYREALPLTLLLNLVWVCLGKILPGGNKPVSGLFGGLILLYVFRGDIIIYSTLVLAYFLLAKGLSGNKLFHFIMWPVAVTNLLAMQFFKSDRSLSDWVSQLFCLEGTVLANSNHVLHWSSLFNMTLLRILSYACDLHNAKTGGQSTEHIIKCESCSSGPCIRGLQCIQADCFELKSFVDYLLYPPILICGPPVTYNCFRAQLDSPRTTLVWQSLRGKQQTPPQKQSAVRYSLRVAASLLAFELFTRFVHAGGTIREPEQWRQWGIIKVEVLSLYALAFIWFKYLIIWRVARATAMFDGVEVYENMNRCIFNNYSVEGFWRAWHRGFNQWIIRYLFVPLGGSKRKTISVWPIFAFVALWHDANPRLVIWAWLCCLTMLPEILIRHYSKKLACYQARWFNYLSALGNALVIKLLVLLNCIGFGLGDSGLAGLQTTASHWSLAEWSFSLVVVSLAVHLMYHVRDLQGWSKGF